MKKFKKGIWTTLKIGGLLLIVLYSIFLVTSIRVQSKIIQHYAQPNTVTDTAIIHFIHGSIPMEGCIYSRPRLGGLLGGHVEIEIDGQVYGFRQKTLPAHIIPQADNLNAKYEVYTKTAWLKRTEYEKMTSIYLPITGVQKANLQAICIGYLAKTPYDYAFFGKRCASSTGEVLAQSGIFPKLSNFESMVAFLSPRPLRNTLAHLAETYHFTIIDGCEIHLM